MTEDFTQLVILAQMIFNLVMNALPATPTKKNSLVTPLHTQRAEHYSRQNLKLRSDAPIRAELALLQMQLHLGRTKHPRASFLLVRTGSFGALFGRTWELIFVASHH